ILMSRVKTSCSVSSGRYGPVGHVPEIPTAFCSTVAATTLINNKTLEFCLQILINLLPYWRNVQGDEKQTTSGGSSSSNNANSSSGPGAQATSTTAPLRVQALATPPDMSPIFLRQYVKGHASDVFESYPQLLTEMVLR